MKVALGLIAATFLGTTAQADTVTGPTAPTAPTAQALGLKYLYINRCKGGCMFEKGGTEDARTNSTTGHGNNDPLGTQYLLSEFAHGDAAWDALMLCLKEVYSPYDIEVTDVAPPNGTAFNVGVAAGSPSELHVTGAGGYASLNPDCSPRAYALSFSFTNIYAADTPDDIYEICAVVAQETGHSFGLWHSFEFLDGRSAGPDPMTYRFYRGQRFFRNEPAKCGEYEPAACGACGSTQNSHLMLTNILGPATPITAPPEITLTSPMNGATVVNGAQVTATASAQRGVATVELVLNGYKWAETKGSYEPDPQGFGVRFPDDVPDGVIDVVLRAKDDIGAATETPPITVTKGAPCATADTCAAGQRCEAGKCFWDAPVGQLGDECTYKQFCVNEQCQAISSGEQRCTQNCVLGIADGCPTGFECLETSATGGVCWPSDAIDKPECGCGASGSPQAALLVLGLGVLLVRRRRR